MYWFYTVHNLCSTLRVRTLKLTAVFVIFFSFLEFKNQPKFQNKSLSSNNCHWTISMHHGNLTLKKKIHQLTSKNRTTSLPIVGKPVLRQTIECHAHTSYFPLLLTTRLNQNVESYIEINIILPAVKW